MLYQRTIFTFVLLATFALALTATAKSKDVIVGSRQYGDYLVHRESVNKPSKWLQVVEADRTFSTDRGEKITQLRLLDQDQKGDGATATVTAGGPGLTYVTVHFKSTRGSSIDFVAELYGKN